MVALFKKIDKTFKFSDINLEKAKKIIDQYPNNKQRSAVMPLLHLAQKQNDNWISSSAVEYIAKFLNIPVKDVYEVVSFYTMFNTQPVGKYLIQVCRTMPCMLRGSKRISEVLKEELKIDMDCTTNDMLFTLKEVECLGACINAPVIQINNEYYERLDEESVKKLLKSLKGK